MSGTDEAPDPATGMTKFNFTATESGGTPVSHQHSIILRSPNEDGGVITITRIVGEFYIYMEDADDINNTVAMGIQLVPFRGDALVEPRFVFDADDAESKEWFMRRLYPYMGYKRIVGAASYECLAGFPSATIDIKTQRRFDTSLFGLVLSVASNIASPLLKFNFQLRLLVRRAEGL